MNPRPAADQDRPLELSCFLVEDSPVIRQNLIATLEEMLRVRVVGSADDAAMAMSWLKAGGQCQLMIVDIFLKHGTGLEVLQQTRALRPATRLVVTDQLRHRRDAAPLPGPGGRSRVRQVGGARGTAGVLRRAARGTVKCSVLL